MTHIAHGRTLAAAHMCCESDKLFMRATLSPFKFNNFFFLDWIYALFVDLFFSGGIQDVLNGKISVCPTAEGNLSAHFYKEFQL